MYFSWLPAIIYIPDHWCLQYVRDTSHLPFRMLNTDRQPTGDVYAADRQMNLIDQSTMNVHLNSGFCHINSKRNKKKVNLHRHQWVSFFIDSLIAG